MNSDNGPAAVPAIDTARGLGLAQPSVVTDALQLVLYPQLAALQFRDSPGIGVRPAVFFVKFGLESSMLGSK